MHHSYENSPGDANARRPSFITPPTSDLFKMYDRVHVNHLSDFREPVKGLWDETALSIAFFSKANIEIIQNGIRRGVFDRSSGQYMIGVQDYGTIKIIMRSLFLQKAKHLPGNIPQQIADINFLVVQYCVQKIYGEAQGYLTYLHDLDTMPVPISMPVMSTTNDNQLELKPWF